MKPMTLFSHPAARTAAAFVGAAMLFAVTLPLPVWAQQEPVVGVQITRISAYQTMTFTIVNGGSGYTTAPNVTISGDGFGAAATATVANGAVTSISLSSAGVGYSSATVFIDPPTGGSSAAGTTTVAGGAVTGVTISSPGSGYAAPPTVVFSGGGGNGATGTATVAGGAVTGVTITAGGTGYTTAPTVSFTGPGVQATATAAIQGTTFSNPNESYGPYGLPITITSVGSGTFLISSFTYEWFVNGTSIGHTTAAVEPPTPASINWTPPQPGSYLITCSITDGTNKATSLAVRYYATGTAILSPNDSTVVPYGSSVVIQATATPPPVGGSGFISRVDFLVDGAVQATDYTYPYSTIYTPPVPASNGTPPAPSTHTFTVIAYDNYNHPITPGPTARTLTMVAPIGDPNNPTTVTLLNPIDGASLTAGSTLHMIANAVAPSGFIKNVDFYVNGVLQSSSQTFPFTSDWKPLVPGQYRIVAIAYDDKSNAIASAPANVTVTGGFPTVSIDTPPSTGINVVQGTTVSVHVTAAGADGGLASLRTVEFLVDGNVNDVLPKNPNNLSPPPVLIDPLNFTWKSIVSVGSHTLAARVTDNNGLTITSTNVPVNVVANKLPKISITAPDDGSSVSANTATTITANASDEDGSVVSVEFFANAKSLGDPVTKAPFQWTWTPTAPGPYALTAKATDDAGGSTTSAAVNVTVNPAATGSSGSNNVYRGDYGSATESGHFTLAVSRSSHGTFIASSTSPSGKIYYWNDFPVSSDGSFLVLDSSNNVLLRGQTSSTGVSGTFGDKTFIGPVTTGSTSPIILFGSLNSDAKSTVVAIVGADNVITLYTAAGGKVDTGTGTVGSSGTYTVKTASGGSVTGTVSGVASLISGSSTGNVSGGFVLQPAASRLVNLSTRVTAGSGDATLIAGFIVDGSGSKPLLIRGVGPTLANFGVSNPLPNPMIALFTSAGTNIGANDDWKNSAAIASAGAQVGAFPLNPDSLDAAIQTTVTPGGYSALLGGAGSSTGVGLVEIYDLDGVGSGSARLKNLSSRALLTSGDTLIAGFVIAGDQRKTLLIRAVGPTLTSLGVSNALSDPKLDVLLGTTTMSSNDNWLASAGSQVVSTTTAVGAFPLPVGSKDSALVIQLGPGGYTAQVTGVGGLTGVVLLEIYDADP